MKNTKRAIRRHHRERMIRKLMSYSFVIWYYDWEPINTTVTRFRATKFHNHAAVCSCSGCGNQRRNEWSSQKEKLTIQERRAYDNYHDMMREVNLYK